MRKFLLLTIFLLFIISISVVNGGENNTNITEKINTSSITDNITVALEDGHLNTSFNNNYNGYCIEYGEQEAKKGDEYYVSSTRDDNTSQYLKRYFVDYYNETQKDVIVTQHMIWHFTDGFDGWRVNKTLVNYIKDSDKWYCDDGVRRWNETHNMKYSFRMLFAQYEHHQDYFVYKIDFVPFCLNNTTDTNNTIITNTTNTTNITEPINNITTNTTKPLNNNTTNTSNTIQQQNKDKTNISYTLNNTKNINLQKYKTGNIIALLLLILPLIIAIIFVQKNMKK